MLVVVGWLVDITHKVSNYSLNKNKEITQKIQRTNICLANPPLPKKKKRKKRKQQKTAIKKSTQKQTNNSTNSEDKNKKLPQATLVQNSTEHTVILSFHKGVVWPSGKGTGLGIGRLPVQILFYPVTFFLLILVSG